MRELLKANKKLFNSLLNNTLEIFFISSYHYRVLKDHKGGENINGRS